MVRRLSDVSELDYSLGEVGASYLDRVAKIRHL
jgi:hypothetical protein